LKCSRCNSELQIVSEYYDFEDLIFIRDYICGFCNSAFVEKFHDNGKYVSDWIDFNA